jgi:hypothetical protein
MQRRTVRSDFGEVTLRQHGIIYARTLQGVEIDAEKAASYHSLVEYLTNGEAHCTVIELSGISAITADARKLLQKQSSEWGKTIAVALVCKTFSARVIAGFFLSVNKPSYPIKIFADQLEATHWALAEYNKFSTRIAS